MIILLDLVKFSLISDEIDHHVECQGISINEYSIVLSLQSVPPGKHGLQSTSIDMTEGGLAYA
jgi:hypothetical protein